MWNEVKIDAPAPEGELLGLECSGKMTEEDFETMHAWLHKKLEHSHRPSIVISLGHFKGYEDLSALWADFKLDTKHSGDFKKIAIVAHQAWWKWLTKIADPMVSANLKWFPEDERDAAVAWASEESA